MQKPSHQPRTFNPALTSARRDPHLEQPRVAQEEMLIYIGKGAGTSPFFGFPGIWASGPFPKTTKASKRKILLLPSLSWLLLWTSMTYMSIDIDITFIQTCVLWIFMSFSCVCNFFYCDYIPMCANVWDPTLQTSQYTLGFLFPCDARLLQSEFTA